MRKLLLWLSTFLISVMSYAQAPEGVNYQAVARDANGDLIVNSSLTVRISILSGAGGSTQEYQETHGISTNEYGLFSLKVGKGAPVSGTFAAINWGSNEHHIKVEVDQGSGFVDMGTTQLMSVPYALYAASSGSGGGGASVLNDLTDVNTTGVSTNQVLSWNGTEWVPITTSGGTTYSAGTGLTLSGTTFINSAPDQVVTLTGGGATSITGTYPNFSVTSTDNNTTYSAGTGLTLSGTTFLAQNSSAIWNANLLQGNAISNTAPASGEILTWNGSQWAPAAASGGSSLWTASGAHVYRSSGRVGISTTSPGFKLHVVAPSTALRGPASDFSAYWSGNHYLGSFFNTTGGASTNDDFHGVASHIAGTDGYNAGLFGLSNGNSAGSNQGVVGYAVNGANANTGVLGVAEGNNLDNAIVGVYGRVYGQGNSVVGNFSRGVYGLLSGTSFVSRGVQGTVLDSAFSSQGVAGFAVAPGDGSGGGENWGILGVASNHPVTNYGVYALATSVVAGENVGIRAEASNGATNYAGYFVGDVFITGNISKGSGTFKIDHPLDPSNKYLVHSFVESPDMMNVFSGNVTTDANGEAIVKLPNYFEAANKDYRYQLTPIGQFAQLIVLEEISNNQFTVKSDVPNVKLSWTVIATRDDKFAQEHRIVDEVEKEGNERGKYLHPELYGASKEQAVYYRDNSKSISHGPNGDIKK